MSARNNGGVFSSIGHRFDQVAVAHVAGKGRRLEENQDSFWPRAAGDARRPVVDYLAVGRLYVVTDGVSQGLRPQEAAQLAAETIGLEYYRLTAGRPWGSDPTIPLQQAVLAAHQALVKASGQVWAPANGAGQGASMQSTCACLLLLGDRFYTAHVGDSRAYLWREGRLYQVTEDHVDAEGHVNRLLGAQLTPGQVTVGAHPPRDLGRLQLDDRLLLCSDGVHRFLSNSRINQILNQREGLASTADALARAAYEQGWGKEDDVTIVLVGVDYDPRRLAELEAQTARLRAARQWLEAIALAEEIAWWQPDFGAPRPIVQTLADLYTEGAFERIERDEALALKMLENAARLGSPRGERYHRLATAYLGARDRWRALRGPGAPLPEKETTVRGLLAASEGAVELFGPQALATAADAALSLAEELRQAGRWEDALFYLAWTMDHCPPESEKRQVAEALAASIKDAIQRYQKVSLEQAWQTVKQRGQDGWDPLVAWSQVCQALLAITDPDVQNWPLAERVARAQRRLYRELVAGQQAETLNRVYAELLQEATPTLSSPARQPDQSEPLGETYGWGAGTQPLRGLRD